MARMSPSLRKMHCFHLIPRPLGRRSDNSDSFFIGGRPAPPCGGSASDLSRPPSEGVKPLQFTTPLSARGLFLAAKYPLAFLLDKVFIHTRSISSVYLPNRIS